MSLTLSPTDPAWREMSQNQVPILSTWGRGDIGKQAHTSGYGPKWSETHSVNLVGVWMDISFLTEGCLEPEHMVFTF